VTGAGGSVPGTGKDGRWFSQRGNREIELSHADRTIRSSSSEREKRRGKEKDALKTELAE